MWSLPCNEMWHLVVEPPRIYPMQGVATHIYDTKIRISYTMSRNMRPDFRTPDPSLPRIRNSHAHLLRTFLRLMMNARHCAPQLVKGSHRCQGIDVYLKGGFRLFLCFLLRHPPPFLFCSPPVEGSGRLALVGLQPGHKHVTC